jgi:hypothetical protein
MRTCKICFCLALALGLVGLLAAAPPGTKYTPQQKEADEKLLAEAARTLTDAMLPRMPRPLGMKWPPIVTLIEDDVRNAYAYFKPDDGPEPQPRIDVHARWMQEIVQNDPDVLALTLGHELGHIYYRHYFDLPDRAEFARYAFTRKQEEQADAFGVQLLLAGGYSLKKALAGDVHLIAPERRHLSRLDALDETHPPWVDRYAKMSQDPAYWHAMSAFANGVTFLTAEQYALAADCFDRVAREFPASYEAWVNRGYAYLMRYCDELSEEDLRSYGVGQVLCGGFYERIKSLQPPTRGRNTKHWKEAEDSLLQALRRNKNLALAKADLGLAYLFHPAGPQIDDAKKNLQDAVDDLAGDRTLDPAARAALLVNLAAARLAAKTPSDAERGLKMLDEAVAQARKLSREEEAPVAQAVLYHRAMARARTEKGGDHRRTVAMLEEYLRGSDPLSAWWPLAFERYEKLCRDAGVPPRSRTELARTGKSALRPPLALDLPGGKKVTLAEPVEDVLQRLGPARQTPVLDKWLRRLRFEDCGVEVLASDEVLAIILASPKSPPVPLVARGPGARKKVNVNVGMSRQAVSEHLGDAPCVRKLFESGPEYDYYRELGLAIRYDRPNPDGKVVEVILARVPDPPQQE